MFNTVQMAWALPAFLLLSGVAGLSTTARAEGPFPPAMRGLIEHAKALAASPYYPPAPAPPRPVPDTIQQTQGPGLPTLVFPEPPAPRVESPVQVLADDFSQTMDALGAQITPDLAQRLAGLERSDADAKVALIAWDRYQHPRLYQELGQRYLHYVRDPLRHFNSPPGVLAAHATEKYRLAWECLLLDPTAGAGAFSAIRATDALERIGNDASLATYELAYATTTDPKINADAVKERQKLLLGSLACFRDQQALLTMLACMALSQQQMAHQPKVWDPAVEVRGLLAPSFNETEMGRWRPTILTAMSLPLPAEQKAFLNSVLKVVPHPIELPPGVAPPAE